MPQQMFTLCLPARHAYSTSILNGTIVNDAIN